MAIEFRGKPGEEVIIEFKEAKIFMKESVAHHAHWLQRSQGLKKKRNPWDLVNWVIIGDFRATMSVT